MGKNVWSTLAIIVGAEPLQVNRDTGRLQYAALRVTRRGGSLSYAMGYFESSQRLPDAPEPRIFDSTSALLLDLGAKYTFELSPCVRPGALGQYTKLFVTAQAYEADHKTAAARLSVEEFKEQGRRQTRNPVPKHRKAS